MLRSTLYLILAKISPRTRTLLHLLVGHKLRNVLWRTMVSRKHQVDKLTALHISSLQNWTDVLLSVCIHKTIQQSSGRRKDTKYNLPVKKAQRLAKLLIPKISDMDRFPLSRTNDCQGLSFTELEIWRSWLCRFQGFSNLYLHQYQELSVYHHHYGYLSLCPILSILEWKICFEASSNLILKNLSILDLTALVGLHCSHVLDQVHHSVAANQPFTM